MALTKTLPTQDASGLPIVDTRLIFAGLVARDSSGNPRLGVIPAHTAALVTGSSGMSYTVAPFVSVGQRSAGVELVANDASTSVATTAAPGSNSRIDVIYWRPQFVLNGDAANLPLFGVVQGTAAASPTKPALPAGAVELATATILSTTTATNTVAITQTFQYTAVGNDPVFVRSAAELTAWTPLDGARATRLDNGVVYKRSGGAWKAWESDPVTYTPTNVGFVVGSGAGAQQFRYWLAAGVLYVEFKVTWGSGASVTSATFDIPTGFNMDTTFSVPFQDFGAGMASNDSGGGIVSPLIIARNNTSTTSLLLLGLKTDSTSNAPYAQEANVSLSVPVSFIAGGLMHGTAAIRIA